MALRALLVLAAIAAPAPAQFFGLATPADGSRIYFATTLRQKNTAQATWGKLFQADRSGLRLVESREYQIPDPPPEGVATGIGLAHPTNPYNLQAASVSADGRVVAVTGWRDCVSGGSYCSKMEHLFTTITVDGKSTDYPGQLRVSPDGAWAFGNTEHPSYDESRYQARMVNIKTGELSGVSEYQSGNFNMTESGHPVANDGTAVFALGNQLAVLARNDIRRFASPGGVLGPVIDASARVIVYAYCAEAPAYFGCDPGAPRSLRAADPKTGESRSLTAEGESPVMDDAGSRVLYISRRSGTPQLRLVRIDGSGDRELTRDPAGIARAVLSGDGSTGFAVTLAGRLVSIDIATGAVQEFVPRTPVYGPAQVPRSSAVLPLELAPSKVVEIPGYGFSDAPAGVAPPLPDSLGGLAVTMQGRRAKLVAVYPSSILAIAPPAIAPGAATVEIDLQSPSPFELPPAVPATVVQSAPEFLYLEGRYGRTIVTAHQDWSGLVSLDSPAEAGEIVHSYAVGLGPTAPPVAYGDAPPSVEPLARLASPLSCVNRIDAMPIDVLFAGLAPGLPGFYQVDWRVPPGKEVYLFCAGANSPVSPAGSVPVRQRQATLQ